LKSGNEAISITDISNCYGGFAVHLVREFFYEVGIMSYPYEGALSIPIK